MNKKKNSKSFGDMMAPKKNMFSAQDNTKTHSQNGNNSGNTVVRAKKNMGRNSK